MNGAKLILSMGISLVVAGAFGWGCSASSSSPSGTDSGSRADVLEADTGAEAGGASCNPYTFDLCPEGQTCCWAGLGGTCTPVGACNSPFRVACENTKSCRDEGVCCASVQFSAVDAAAVGDSTMSDAGPGYGFTLTLACETRCTFPELQVCLEQKDCQNGEVCANISRPNQQPVYTCVPPDAGFLFPDASPEDASPAEDGGVPDASPTGGDASDAGVDAPSNG
jgi:hypothetical protein